MNITIRDRIFLFMSFSLIFNMIPIDLQIWGISGHWSPHLLQYPAFIGVFYSIWCQYKYRNVFYKADKVVKYLMIYFIILLVSLIVGLYKFPYYEILCAGPITQIAKLPVLLEYLQSWGIDIAENTVLLFWFAARQVKMVFADSFYAFGFSYMIYCWYRNDWRNGFKIFCKGVLFSIIFVALYCIIEVWFLSGSKTAESILVTINPYIHAIKIVKNRWPPLLSWPNQLRAVFPEPSHMGNYIAYSLPVLWYYILKTNNKFNLVSLMMLGSYFSFLIFLSRARTAIGMYFGLWFLLILISLFIFKKCVFKRVIALVVCGVVVFLGSITFIDLYMTPTKNMQVSNEVVKSEEISNSSINYVNDNLLSLTSKTKRSNIPRYGYLTGSFKVGMNNFFLGTGRGLQTMYVLDAMTPFERKHPEVRNWEKYIKKQGLARNGIDAMNEYVSRFCQTGIMGLLIFLLPFIYVLKKLFKGLFCSNEGNKLEYAMLFVMLIGGMVAAMNGSIFLNYSVWLVLGLAFALVDNVNFVKKED